MTAVSDSLKTLRQETGSRRHDSHANSDRNEKSERVRKSASVRIPEFDALRGLAALAVVWFHYSAYYEERFGELPIPLMRFTYGELGVDLFFVLSGFVILLTADRCKGGVDFTVARAIRLWPAFFICCTITFLVLLVLSLPNREVTFTQYIANLTLQPNLLRIGEIDGVYWTLFIEVQFYAIVAVLIFLGLRRHLLPLFAAFVGMSIIYQFSLDKLGTDNFAHYYLGIIRHSHEFLAGMLCYRYFQTRKSVYLWLLIPCSVGVLTSHWMRVYRTSVTDHFIFFWIAVGLVLLVSLHTNAKSLAVLRSPALLFLGAISYPLYLLHMDAGFTVLNSLQLHGAKLTLVTVGLLLAIVGLAALITYYWESPIRNRLNALRKAFLLRSEAVRS